MSIKSEKSNMQDAEEVEDSLKEFIDYIMKYYDYFKIDGTIIENFEKKLNDSDTLLQVFEIIKNMFKKLMENILNNKNDILDCSEISNYDDKNTKKLNFEKVLVNYENEIKIIKRNEKHLNDLLLLKEKKFIKQKKTISFLKNEITKLQTIQPINMVKSSYKDSLKLKNIKNQTSSKNLNSFYNKSNWFGGLSLTKRSDNINSKIKQRKKIKINSIVSQDKTIKAIKPKNLIQPKNKNKLNIKNSKSFNYFINKNKKINNISKL